ncbi:hypothetical protein ACHAPT_010799 [Fusarium lateritium]
MSAAPEPNLASLDRLSDSYAKLFDAIDSLRDAGLQRKLIPKLVVIGDQNSGKSSVLEAICDIPFPVNDGLCTRFPTQVVQRRSSEELIEVTIITDGDGAHNRDLDTFSKQLSSNDSVGLDAAIQEASSLIVNSLSSTNDGKHFSAKVLNIAVSGPTRYPLTLVDLPGLFWSSTKEQNHDDRAFVDEVVWGYLQEKRNAFLLVVSASAAWANMLIPEAIRSDGADADGSRSLGIITKLDKLCGQQERAAWFAEGRAWNPREGWHCLRNRSDEERKRGVDRNETETAFFRDNPVDVDETCKGVAHLRPRLSKFLASQIRQHLRTLSVEVRGQIGLVSRQLDLLGKKDMSGREQRDYLARMAGDFQLLCCNAVNGQYGEGTVPVRLRAFFNDPKDLEQKSQDKRLQAVVRAMGQLFGAVMMEKGKLTKVSKPSRFADRAMRDGSFDRSGQTYDTHNEERGVKDNQKTDWRVNESESGESYEEEEGEVEEEGGGEEEEGGGKEEEDAEKGEGQDEDHSQHPTRNILRSETRHEYESFPQPTQKSRESFESQVLGMAAQWRGIESMAEVNPTMVSRLFGREASP